MSKKYYTKTGIELTVINGGKSSQSDTELIPVFDEYNQFLQNLFGAARIYLKHVNYIGLSRVELVVNFSVPTFETKNQKTILGQLTVDLSNYLSRFHGFNEYSVPSVDVSRAKNGVKSIQYIFEVSESTAEAMGLSQKESCKAIQGVS